MILNKVLEEFYFKMMSKIRNDEYKIGWFLQYFMLDHVAEHQLVFLFRFGIESCHRFSMLLL
jgi:hypothetical protein